MWRSENWLLFLGAFLIFNLACTGCGNGGGKEDADAEEDVLPDEGGEQEAEADAPEAELAELEEGLPEEGLDALLDAIDAPETDVEPGICPCDPGDPVCGFCCQLALGLCEYVESCCTSPEIVELSDLVDCRDPQSGDFYESCDSGIRPYYNLGNVTIYDAAIPGCLGIFTTMAAECPNFNSSPFMKKWYMDSGCGGVAMGLVSPNGGCLESIQCQGDFYCRRGAEPTDPRACTARVAAGEACTDDNDDICTTGLVCISGQCSLPSELDGPCDGDGDCWPGLYCDETAGTCTVLLGATEECNPAADICAGMCDDSLSPPVCRDICNGL